MLTKRGVRSYWRGTNLGYSDETICLCRCHVERIRHIVACCHEPKTEAGRLLLEAYNKGHDFKIGDYVRYANTPYIGKISEIKDQDNIYVIEWVDNKLETGFYSYTDLSKENPQ
jgi:hypothetical protein